MTKAQQTNENLIVHFKVTHGAAVEPILLEERRSE
jgi:hypothetical protein